MSVKMSSRKESSVRDVEQKVRRDAVVLVCSLLEKDGSSTSFLHIERYDASVPSSTPDKRTLSVQLHEGHALGAVRVADERS